MRKILLLGASGFIGRNVLLQLNGLYDVAAPDRSELNLLDAESVKDFLERNCFDAVIHLAMPTGHSQKDDFGKLFELSLKTFMTVVNCFCSYGKMIYIGSGAEYGKHRAIVNIHESAFGRQLPEDTYAFSRFMMSSIAEKYNNIYNLRLFGCYGIGDPAFKLIPHVISCIRENKPIVLKQNAFFDFLYVKDIVSVLAYFIENEPAHKAYNLCAGTKILTGDIAKEVRRQMCSDLPIVFKQSGYGLEYTGNNARLRSEIQSWNPRPISEGIKEIVEYENRDI